MSIASKNTKKVTENPPIRTYVTIIENRIKFENKTGYCLELLMSEIMKLLGSTKNKMTKDKNGQNVTHLEITIIVLIHCNFVNNAYQHDSRVFHTFVPNKSFVHLSDILTKNFIILKNFNSEFSYIEVWFTDGFLNFWRYMIKSTLS